MAQTPTLSSAGHNTVVIGAHSGHAVVAKDSPLARLNYFDGKFLRASDLSAEQQALLAQVQLVARAGGAGLVHGLDCSLVGTDTLRVTPGTGIDWTGRPLVLSDQIELSIGGLIDASSGIGAARGTAATGAGGFGPCALSGTGAETATPSAAVFYLVTAHPIEAFCGSEDVFGKLCSEACITGSQASKIVPGLCLRAQPITLDLKPVQIALGDCQLRSRCSSAYFEAERQAIPALIGSEGVLNPLWCLGAAAAGGDGVPLALLARQGIETVFVDAWAVRRERFEMPPAQYWAWRMAMRPRPVFWAQVAQFQCMLECCLSDGVPVTTGGGCDPVLTRESARNLRVLTEFYSAAAKAIPTAVGPNGLVADLPEVAVLERQIADLEAAGATPASDRILVDCGIVELPSAGYLPVAPSATLSVNRQVRSLLGPGVDLRFCTVRPDFVPHALEEAQHMERICLLQGLDDPDARPEVDILVPDGEILSTTTPSTNTGHRASIGLDERIFEIGIPPKTETDIREAAVSGSTARRTLRSVTASLVAAQPFAEAAAPSVEAVRPSIPETARDLPVTAEGAARTVPEATGPRIYSAGHLVLQPGLTLNRASAIAQTLQFGVWLEFEMAADPATATVGTRLPLSGRLLGASAGSGAGRSVLRSLAGEIRIEGATAISGGRELTGRLLAELTSRTTGLGGTGNASILPLTGTVRLRLRTGADGRSEETLILSDTSLFANLPGAELTLTRRWTGATRQTIEIVERFRADTGFRDSRLMRLDLDRDDGALKPGHPAHSKALQGIEVIATVTGQPGESELAEAKLFPPPGTPPQTLDLRATLPWVLFHRRRTKQCAVEAETPAPLPQRNYRLFNVSVTDGDTDPEALEKIISSGGLDRLLQQFPPRPDGAAAFVEGQARLATQIADLRADWDTVLPRGSEAMYGVIASKGSVLDEGDTIAASRLATVTTALTSVMPAATGYAGRVVGQVPALADAGSLDGAILYFTRPSQALCHTVYRVAIGEAGDLVKRIESYLANPDADLGPFLAELGATALVARPRFADDAPDLLTETDRAQLTSAWQLAGGGTATAGFSVSARRAANSIAAVAAQSSTIARVTGSALDLGANDHRTLSTSRLGTCPRATILFVGTHCTTVAYHLGEDSLDRRVEALLAAIKRNGLPAEVFQPNPNGETPLTILDALDFLDVGTPVARSAEVLRERWASVTSDFAAIAAVAYIAVARTEADLPRARADAETVAKTLDMAATSFAEVVIPTGSTLAVDCRNLTIPVVIVRRG